MTQVKKTKVFLTGGWGYGNIGDDAILMATLNSLRTHAGRARNQGYVV